MPYLDIILLAMLAGFVIFKLHSVLGRRTGTERKQPDPFADAPTTNDNANVVQLPDRSQDSVEADDGSTPASSMAAGVMRIKLADDRFDER